jgi:hypothetical protein
MLTRTLFGHCEDAGLTSPWRRSRRVCPAASVLTADSQRNGWVCRAAPRRTPTIYTTATSMNTFSLEKMNTHTYTIAVYKRDTDYIFYNHQNKKTYSTKVVWNSEVSYSPKEILNGGSCATNLTKFGQIGFKRNWSLHQTKLETDCQNAFTSSRCIFFM